MDTVMTNERVMVTVLAAMPITIGVTTDNSKMSDMSMEVTAQMKRKSRWKSW